MNDKNDESKKVPVRESEGRRNEIIKQLKALEDKIGRIPKSSDVDKASKKGECFSSNTMRHCFGTFKDALLATGFEASLVSSRKNSAAVNNKKVIKQFGDLVRNLGRKPSVADINAAHKKGECVSYAILFYRFGGIKELYKKTKGSRVNETKTAQSKKKKLIQKANSLMNELSDVLKKLDSIEPASTTPKKISKPKRKRKKKAVQMNKANKLERQEKAKQDIIEQIQKLSQKLGRLPMIGDIEEAKKRNECVTWTTIYKYFGSLRNLFIAAGLDLNEPTKEVICQQLKDLSKELDRIPTQVDVDEARREGKCFGVNAIKKCYSTFIAALEDAGLNEEDYRKNKIICQLQDLANKLGRRPRTLDVVAACNAGTFASTFTLIKYFGSFKKALEVA